MTYDLDFFEAWNEMDKLYEDEGNDINLELPETDSGGDDNNSETPEIAEIKAGIEEALKLYSKNDGIPYEGVGEFKGLINEYKNASDRNLEARDIGFWYVVGLILANIPSYETSKYEIRW